MVEFVDDSMQWNARIPTLDVIVYSPIELDLVTVVEIQSLDSVIQQDSLNVQYILQLV